MIKNVTNIPALSGLISIVTMVFIIHAGAFASSGGFTNRTNKNGNTSGCGGCHGGSATASVLVSINGPASVNVNQVVAETLSISGGPAIGAGCDIASTLGQLAPVSSYLYLAGSDLTQSYNTAMSGGKVMFIFNYTAPANAQSDTIFAVGLSTNSNGSTSGDSWNWAPKKVITVTSGSPVDTTAPTISITSPLNGVTVAGTLNITATASDNVGVVGVQFQLNGVNAGSEDLTAPYSYSWNTKLYANGSYSVSAIARDAAGNKATSSITVNVSNVVGDTTAPVVAMILPLNGDTLANTITLTATASDNIGVVGVQFQVNGINSGIELTSPPYTYPWNTTLVGNGSYAVSVIARDAAGNMSTSSVTITVHNAIAPQSAGFQVVAADNFNRPDQASLSGGKWSPILNQTGSGTMKLISNAIEAYNASGVGNGGGVVWDSLVSKGSGITLSVVSKANNNSYTSMFMYARMNTKDLTTGNGYRFRYVDNPGGNALLAIQIVKNGTLGTDLVSTTHAVNGGDTLKFIVENDANSTLVGYVNGTQVLSVVDTTYNPSTWYFWVRGMVLPTLPTFNNFTLISKVPAAAATTQISSFTATVSSSTSVDLNWTTLNETNNSGFYIERRSQPGSGFQVVSNLIPGAGTGSSNQYTWKDGTITAGTYYYRLKQVSSDGSYYYSGEIITTVNGVTGVNEEHSPRAFQLAQNYPNPFNPSTVIKYQLPAQARVILMVYNMLGEEVAVLANEMQTPGAKEVSWNSGSMPSGMYFYRLTAGNFTQTKKMLLVK
ncbi:MAG: choice-of-anchor V domain-containing protein [Bacteroidota bacterium]